VTISLDSSLVNELGKSAIYPAYYAKIEGVPYFFGWSGVAAVESAPLVYGMKKYGPQPSGADVGVTYKYGDSITTDTGGVVVKNLHVPTGFDTQAMPEQGTSSFGGVEVRLQNCSELRAVIAGYSPLKNRKISLYVGAANVPATKWVNRYTGIINTTKLWPDGLGWTITAVDIKRTEKSEIFLLAQTQIRVGTSFDVTNTSVLYVDSGGAGQFATASGTLNPPTVPAQYLLRIGDELISYVSRTADQFGVSGVPGSLTRGALGTTAVTHNVGDKMTEFLILRGHPLDIARWVLLSTGLGTNTGGGTNYDVLPARHGLGVSWKYIDVASAKTTSFESAKTSIGAGDMFEFRITEKEDARSFLASQIYKPSNILPIIYGNGQEGVAVFAPPLPSDDLFVFDPSNIVDGSARLTNNEGRLFNVANWSYDYDPIGRRYVGMQPYENADSISHFGGRFPMAFECRGMRSTLSALALIINRSERFMTRFASAPVEIEFDAIFGSADAAGLKRSCLQVEMGDLVLFTSRRLKDPKTGEAGVGPICCQIIGITPQWERGSIRFKAQWAFADFRYGRWPYWTQGNYSTATQIERDTFGFLADGDPPLVPATPSNTGEVDTRPYHWS
jgi:hypothetical protein